MITSVKTIMTMMFLMTTIAESTNNKLKAYDCTRPFKVTNYMINQESCVTSMGAKPGRIMNVTLLQKTEIHEQIGYRCAIQV